MTQHLRLSIDQYEQHQKRVSGESTHTSAAAGARGLSRTFSPRDPVVPKRRKYGGKPCYYDRSLFRSEGERDRYKELRLLERADQIRDLVTQPVFPLIVDGVRIGTYRADFRYLDKVKAFPSGVEIIEDFKSPVTAAKETFRRTVKHIEAQYGIRIVIVMKGGRA